MDHRPPGGGGYRHVHREGGGGRYGVDLVNVVTGSGGPDDDGNGEGDNPPTSCAADVEDVDDQCTTTHTVDPTWTLAKTSDDPDGKAEPGQVITYTLTATPLGENVDALTGLVITDDLSDVVADGKATFEAILGDDVNAVLNEEAPPWSGRLTGSPRPPRSSTRCGSRTTLTGSPCATW